MLESAATLLPQMASGMFAVIAPRLRLAVVPFRTPEMVVREVPAPGLLFGLWPLGFLEPAVPAEHWAPLVTLLATLAALPHALTGTLAVTSPVATPTLVPLPTPLMLVTLPVLPVFGVRLLVALEELPLCTADGATAPAAEVACEVTPLSAPPTSGMLERSEALAATVPATSSPPRIALTPTARLVQIFTLLLLLLSADEVPGNDGGRLGVPALSGRHQRLIRACSNARALQMRAPRDAPHCRRAPWDEGPEVRARATGGRGGEHGRARAAMGRDGEHGRALGRERLRHCQQPRQRERAHRREEPRGRGIRDARRHGGALWHRRCGGSGPIRSVGALWREQHQEDSPEQREQQSPGLAAPRHHRSGA